MKYISFFVVLSLSFIHFGIDLSNTAYAGSVKSENAVDSGLLRFVWMHPINVHANDVLKGERGNSSLPLSR